MEKWLRRQDASEYTTTWFIRKIGMKEAGSILMLKVSFFMEKCNNRQSTLNSTPISYKLF